MSNLTNEITSGLVWKIFERFSIQILSFILSVWIARIVIPEAYGIITIATAIVDTLSVFINSGLGSALIQDKNSDKSDFSSAFFINLFLATVIYIVIFISSPLVSSFYEIEEMTAVLRVHSLTIIISCFYQIQVNYCDKNTNFKNEFIASLFSVALSGTAAVILAYKGYGIWALIVQGLLNILVSGIILSIKNKFFPNIFKIKKLSRSSSSSGVNFVLTDFISTVFNNLNSFIIGKKYSATTLAFYNKGYYIPSLINTNVDTIVSSVYYPNISKENNDETIANTLKETVEIETYIMAPVYLGLIAIANNLLIVFLTETWIDSSIYVKIFSVGGLLSTIAPIDVAILKAKGKSDKLLKMEFIKKPIRLLLTFISLKFNIVVLSFVCVISELVDAFVNSIEIGKILNVSFLDKLKIWIKSVLPAIPMFIIVLLLNALDINNFYALIIQLIVGVLVFVATSKIFKVKSFEKVLNLIKK